MQALRTVSQAQIADLVPTQPRIEELSLARTSVADLPTFVVDALELMMAETQARYPNQELPPGTPAMYGAEWAEMTQRYGLEEFRGALLRVIRNRERKAFFPEPGEIEAECVAYRRTQRERTAAQKAIQEHDDAKATWLREREEDIANGIARPAHPEPVESIVEDHERLRAGKLAAAPGVSIEAFIAAHVTPEGMTAVHERMAGIVMSVEEIKARVAAERAGAA